MSTIFDKICETFSLNPHEAEIFIKTAPERYKLHSISKRHGEFAIYTNQRKISSLSKDGSLIHIFQVCLSTAVHMHM